MSMNTTNPLTQPWIGPHGLPPFDQIRPEHIEPAFEQALQLHRAEIDAIVAQTAAPTFDNTVVAFDRSGRLLVALEGYFFNVTASETSPELQAVQLRMAQPLAAHANAIYLNAALFERLDAVHRQREALGLGADAQRLLERLHRDFVRSGARLEPAVRSRYAQITERLAELTTRFGQNVLAEEAAYRLELQGESELAGLPDFVRDAARAAAQARGLEGHVITLSRSLIVPFLTFSDRRDLREQAWRAWTSRGEKPGETDNREIVREILLLRAEQARLHGHAAYADYALEDTMAGTQSAVNRLLDDVWTRSVAAVERERQQLEAIRAECPDVAQRQGPIEAWDWRYWAEKVRQRTYAIDDAEVKPYFPLDRMVEAAFDCAQRLFGIRFVSQPDLVLYHPDVRAYEVQRVADGRPVGLFLHDNYARPTKRSGAWMSAYRMQSRIGAAHGAVQADGSVLPIIVNNNNFAKGAPGEPTLLSFDDVRTLFHEFGHGLHGLLSDVRFERLSGTQVLRDFVELPSQLFEHWIGEPEVLRRHARHVVTNEPIPQSLIDRLHRARSFGQGYETVRYTASALIDMAIHARPLEQVPADVVAFEAEVLQQRGLPPGVGLNHRYTHFQHLFAGSSYAAGYYVYLWAEVLDADAFDAFREAGSPFDGAVAERLLRHIYSAGDSVEPGVTYRAFRGRDARVEPMLRKKGLLPETEPA